MIKNKKIWLGFIITLPLVFNGFISGAEKTQKNEEDYGLLLQEQISQRSHSWYEKETDNGKKCLEFGEYWEPFKTAFQRLTAASGYPGFNAEVCLIKNDAFNAATFPGGQFLIFTGTLQRIDQEAQSYIKQGKLKNNATDINNFRENVLAAVFAHELAHYYNHHMFKAVKMFMENQASNEGNQDKKKQKEFDVRAFQFSQEQETDADLSGIILLQKAGYNPNLMAGLLELMNEITQADLANGAKGNIYLDSHPSPHKRLAAIKSEVQDIHVWAANMEQAFMDIQIGKNLDRAIGRLDNALQMVPGNLWFRAARAVALHKKWLNTVPLAQQKLRSIVYVPAFQDAMLAQTEKGSRGLKKIPGDEAIYLEAANEYREIFENFAEPWLLSNFGTLLAYSPNAEVVKAALSLTAIAAKAAPGVTTLNNMAVVLYFDGQENQAKEIFVALVKAIAEQQASLKKGDEETNNQLNHLREVIRKNQLLDEKYVFEDFTPLLNLALIYQYAELDSDAKFLAENYLTKYEDTSEWSKYLADLTKIKIAAPEILTRYEIKGIKTGDSLKTVVENWGKPVNISSEKDADVWYYEKTQTRLFFEQGFVWAIQLLAPDSPKLMSKIGVGTNMNEIENILGKSNRMVDLQNVYEKGQPVLVQYSDGKAKIISILER
jgi:hypothetical protein